MSFASETKRELIDLPIHVSTAKAELSALIKLNGRMTITSNGIGVEFRTKTPSIARRVVKLVTICYNINVTIAKQKIGNMNKSSFYVVKINQNTKDILEDLHLLTSAGISNRISKNMLNTSNVKRAYLRGCFLATGSVNSPDKSTYHLEILTHSEIHARDVIKILADFDINARLLKREKGFIIYVKEAEKIADFLRMIEAIKAVLTFEDVRIFRDMNNSVNRIRNCDIANLNKTWNASKKQLDNMNLILDTFKREDIDEKLLEVIDLRLEYPEATLNDLSEYSENKISKSGINHRIRKINKMADKIRGKL